MTPTPTVPMPARTMLAIAVLALRAGLCPLPAPAQSAWVPPAEAPPAPGNRLVSGPVLTVAGLLFAGALAGDYEFREESQERRDGLSNVAAQVGNTFGDWRLIVPGLTAGYLAGEIAGSSATRRAVVEAGAAAALATGLVGGLKLAFGRARPNAAGGSFEFRPFSGAASFPSGHTAVAFALATTVADRTDDGWSDYLLYGAATLTALSRVNDDKHWVSDVLAGGLLGHLSARWVSRRMGPIQVTPAGVSVSLRW